MKKLNIMISILPALLALSACKSQPNATIENCMVSDSVRYKAVGGYEAGMEGPNAAGQEVSQVRIVGDVPNRYKSQLGFKYKGKVLEKLQCKTEKITCEDASATWCQAVDKCEITLDAGAVLNVVDTPKSDFYETTEPTYFVWNGETVKCGNG